MEETSSHNLSSLPRANRHTKEYRIGKHVHYLARDGRGYPHLHRIFKKRLFAGVPDLSRCAHDIQIIYKDKSISSKARSDSEPYQYHAELNNWWYARKQADDTGIDITHAIPTWRKDCCDQIHQRFIIYGIIGSGSYGVVLAARERYPADKNAPKHFALKVEYHIPQFLHGEVANSDLTQPYYEVDNPKGVTPPLRYIPKEAIVLNLSRTSHRFPKIDSVYVHEQFQVTVMSAFSLKEDPMRNRLPDMTIYPSEYRFPGFSGDKLMNPLSKETKLTEIEVCKVASQLLEAIVFLMDMNILHDDLSPRNYLVDENLNVKLIDFGFIRMSLDDDDYNVLVWSYLPAQEYQVPPELALELAKPSWVRKDNGDTQLELKLTQDARVKMLWKFGVIVYELLHGYAPWEDGDDLYGLPLRMNGPFDGPETTYRRWRIINSELPIDENLSQDCADVLRAMLVKNINKRPTIHELTTYPWFQGHWANRKEPYKRPDWPVTMHQNKYPPEMRSGPNTDPGPAV